MKYIKRFNEELSPHFLRKFAKIADEKGGYYKTDSAPTMREYADLVEWKENVKRSEKNGVIQLELRTGQRRGQADQDNFIGEFHPEVTFGLDMFNDHLDNEEGDKDIYFTIFINAVITTEEGLNEMNDAIYEYEDSVTSNANKHQEGGKIWMAYADMTIKLENGTFSIKPLDFYENDSCVVDVKVLNRRSSGIIRNAVINEFKSDYDIYFQGDGRSEKHHFENANEAIDAIFAKHGLSSEYGISYEDIYEHILRTPSNVFRFKDLFV